MATKRRNNSTQTKAEAPKTTEEPQPSVYLQNHSKNDWTFALLKQDFRMVRKKKVVEGHLVEEDEPEYFEVPGKIIHLKPCLQKDVAATRVLLTAEEKEALESLPGVEGLLQDHIISYAKV